MGVAAFVLVGIATLFFVRAASSTASLEPENGTPGGAVRAFPHASASNGAAVKFTASTTYSENFESFATNNCPGYTDGSKFGQWETIFAGYGCVNVVQESGNKYLSLQPKAVTSSGTTSAALVVGPTLSNDQEITGSTATLQQLRTGSSPNAWEVAWIIWNYSDNYHFYYFTLKPNGWELGKEDPAYPGAQRFLATGTNLSMPIGQWYNFKINQTGTTIKVYVNGTLLTTFTDTERPYTSGRAGMYTEDARVGFDNWTME